MLFFILFLFTLCAVPSYSQAIDESAHQVWKVGDRQWSVEEERHYGQWVEENITEDFFIRYKIPVDCADVPYAVRWIYARIAHLPAAATTKDNKWIGHWSTEWGRLPTHPEWHQDLRFRRALLHMLAETTTRTLPLDTYPIRIVPEAVIPGTPFFVTESHSGVVGRVILDGSHVHPLQTWEATVPAKIQKLNRRNFFTPRPESTIYSGLVKFRWPVFHKGRWEYLPVKEHPYYSEEQYASDFYEGYADYVEAVAKRIDPVDYNPREKAEKVIETMTHYLQERVSIVSEGLKRCHEGECPEGSPLWEDYSTPGRDGMITLWMDHLHQIIESNHLDHDGMREKMEAIPFDITPDRTISFYHLYQNYLWLSPHPEDSIEARWGLCKCEMILSQIQSAENSIVFIETTYGKRDPNYAGFAIRGQQEVLRRLCEEWKKSLCEGARRLKKVRENEWKVESNCP